MAFFSFLFFATLLARVWLTVGRVPGDRCTFRPFRPALAKSISFFHPSIPFRFRYDVYERTFLGALLLSTIAVVFANELPCILFLTLPLSG